MDSGSSAMKPLFPRRGVHLDLKGVPPTFERLMALLDVFVAAHYNVLLVEWEDSFPWTVDPRFCSETAYSPPQVRQFMEAAAQKGLEVIPLVQCLGHMETPLGLADYAHLREVPDRSDVLNPLAAGARELVQRMVEDVLALSPQVRYFHLGGDEAWTLGTHPDTQAYIQEHGKDALYLHHVGPLLALLAGKHIRPILWHDMMIHWSAPRLSELADQADLMVWGYRGHPATADPKAHYHHRHIEYLKQCGLKLWCAGAFKGGDRMDSDLPDFAARQANALAWTQVHRTVGFEGAVATGWSRYNTCSLQTCPLDSSLDTLVDLGWIFFGGQPVEGGSEGCAALLDGLGEGQRYRSCRQAMEELARARSRAWENVIMLRELMVTARRDPRRCGGSDVQGRLRYLRQHVSEADSAADLMRQAFAGLIPALWIERYLDERLVPLKDELAQIERTSPSDRKKSPAAATQSVTASSVMIATRGAGGNRLRPLSGQRSSQA